MSKIIDKWVKENNFHCEDFSNIERLVRLKEDKRLTISLCIPTLNEEKTIGKIIRVLKKTLMLQHKLLDEIAVIDSGSTDKTKEIALKCGADFYLAKNYLKSVGNFRGKGENLWL